MINILVFGMTENPGGVESFLMNYYRRIDLSRFHFDFLCNSYEPIAFEDEILSMGGRTIHFTSRRKNPFKFYRELGAFFKEHAGEYDIVWVNVNSLANIDYLKMAKKYCIPRRIIHSHNAKNMDTWLRGLLHEANRKAVGKYATDFWACSKYAAKWFYAGRRGRGRLRHKAVIIRNAIDVGKIQDGISRRNQIRDQLGWKNNYIMSCIGRLHFQKNQKFAVDVLARLLPDMPDARLLLVGQGEDEQMLRAHVKEAGVEDAVFFAGVVEDVSEYLAASDLFLFPSVFEGLGIAGLESQASGLVTLASEGAIPKDIAVTDLLHFLPLEQGAAAWAEEIIKLRADCPPRPVDRDDPVFSEIRKAFVQKGYDSAEAVRRLEKLLAEQNY